MPATGFELERAAAQRCVHSVAQIDIASLCPELLRAVVILVVLPLLELEHNIEHEGHNAHELTDKQLELKHMHTQGDGNVLHQHL